jgi:hypothetical protein
MNTKTGEFNAIEVNSTVQTHGIRDYSEIDIDREIAKYIDNDLKGYSAPGLASDHIEQKVELPELARKSLEELVEE